MKIVIIGSTGRLGTALMRDFAGEHELRGFSHAQIDLDDLDEAEQLIRPLDFDLLINCAALTNVDLCEEQSDVAFRVNSDAPGLLAELSAEKGARMIHFSTDYVFDGSQNSPYREQDPAYPISVYGRSKLEGEEAVLGADPDNLVIRVSWVFGPERASFIDHIIQRARQHETITAVADKISTPTFTGDISGMLRNVLPGFKPENDPDQNETEPDYRGILHFANSGECSWQEYAQYALDCCVEVGIPLKARTVDAITLADMKNWLAKRPVYSVLSVDKYAGIAGARPRSWQEAVREYVREFVR